VRVLPLGKEAHPLSVTSGAATTDPASAAATPELTVVVSAGSGDWSRALAALARSSLPPPRLGSTAAAPACQLEVEIAGPFPAGAAGGHGWCVIAALRQQLAICPTQRLWD
jgi:hypothetical protein